jgi:hypothetical protein
MEMEYDSDDLQDGILALVSAMLRLAVKDFKKGKSRKDDVVDFLESEWFIQICGGLGVSYKEVKKRICGDNNYG